MTYIARLLGKSRGQLLYARRKNAGPENTQRTIRDNGKEDGPAHCDTITQSAFDALTSQRQSAENHYKRERDLPGLLHLFPAEIAELDNADSCGILRALTRALRAERKRGLSGHWRYSISRHIALMQSLHAEKLHLDQGPGHKTQKKAAT